MKTLAQTAIIVAACTIAALATYWFAGPPQRQLPCDPSNIPADSICLQSLPTDQAILWVDARSRGDWQRNGLAGSVLWNLDEAEDMQAMEAEVAMKVMETPYVVVYCGDEHCGTSRQIAERIRNLDMGAEAHVLHGGWRTLQQAGLTPDRPNQSR